MATEFTYTKEVNVSVLTTEIRESTITVALDYISSYGTSVTIFFKADLSSGEVTTLNTIIANHVYDQNIVEQEPRDSSGKQLVHSSARKIDTINNWTCKGDDTTDPDDIGGGTLFDYTHSDQGGWDNSQEQEDYLYLDFNILNGEELFIREGALIWSDGADRDRLTLELTTILCTGEAGQDTNYNVVNGMVIPIQTGDGTYDLDEEALTDPQGGLVYFPLKESGLRQICFFDADWNNTTKQFENITPNYDGTGEYNIFSTETILARYFNNIVLIDSGNRTRTFNSDDFDQFGHGMRIKITLKTVGDDHSWQCSMSLTTTRTRTI